MSREIKRRKAFSSEEISVFCEQTALLLNSGIPIYDGVHMLYEEIEDKRTKKVLAELEEQVRNNVPLHEALKKVEVFPAYMMQMVKIGEYSGKLEDVMHFLSVYYERETNVKISIKNAVRSPLIVFTMASAIMLLMAWRILPLFKTMFLELNAEISQNAQTMMNIGLTLGTIIAVINCIIMALIIILLLIKNTPFGIRIMEGMIKKLEMTNKLSEELAVGRFISGMSLMISSGMDMEKSLEMIENITTHKKVKEKIGTCYKLVSKKNMPIEEAVRNTDIITGMESSLLTIAGRTGALDTAFAKLSEQYQIKTTDRLHRLSTIVETSLIIFLTVTIGVVLLAVMLPLVSMISSIG